MKMKVNLNTMHYTQFIAHLKSKGIEYTEQKGVDMDEWMCGYIAVIPLRGRIKERCFDMDGGGQLK